MSLRAARGLLLAALVPFPALAAQSLPQGTESGGTIVRAIELDRRDIFDPEESHLWYARIANGLHVTTRASVLRRELLFRVGEPYDSSLVAETARNLRALGIFRRVRIDSVRTDSGLVMRVLTKDGWSTKPDFRFRSVGGEVAFTIAFIEENLLGTASKASAFYDQDPDRSTVTFEFRRSRLFAGAVGLGLRFEDRSDGLILGGVVEKPFHSLDARSGVRVDGESRRERVLRFFEGERTASDTLQRRFAVGRIGVARALRASPAGYLRLGAVAQVRRDDYLPDAAAGPFGSTVTAAVGPVLEWRRASFLVTAGFFRFAREEDVDLSTTVRLGALVAPRALGYDRDGIGPSLTVLTGARLPGGFVLADLVARGLYTRAGLDSGTVAVAGTLALQPGARHLAILHADAGWRKAPPPGQEFDLGLNLGPRAFRTHSFTGDRAFFLTAEYRWTLSPDLWKLVGVGLAGFVDHGGAWYAGSPRRTGWDAGIGIRLAPSRAADAETVRVDLARRFANDREEAGWVLAVGKGFLFSLVRR